MKQTNQNKTKKNKKKFGNVETKIYLSINYRTMKDIINLTNKRDIKVRVQDTPYWLKITRRQLKNLISMVRAHNAKLKDDEWIEIDNSISISTSYVTIIKKLTL